MASEEKKKKINMSTCAKNENNADDIQHAADLQVDLVHQKSNIVIAFVETDVRNDFYLFNVTSKGTEVLESNLNYDMDVHMPRGPLFSMGFSLS